MSQSARQLWAELRLHLHGFQTMKEGDETWKELQDYGIQSSDLRRYIKLGCPRKVSDARCLGPVDLKRVRNSMVASGGSVSGGSAVRIFHGEENSDRDIDLFFPTFPSFVAAHLSVLKYSNVDICLYKVKPWELFDLEVACCAWDSSGFDSSPGFINAWDTGISDVRLDCIVHPIATLRRVDKYGARYGLKFPGDKLILMAASVPGNSKIIRKAMAHRN